MYLRTFQLFLCVLSCIIAIALVLPRDDISDQQLQNIFDDDFKSAIILCKDR